MPKKFSKKPTTFFKERVSELVRKIPEGKVLSYREVAKLALFPRSWRAVGNILNKNQDPKIPCHRVIRNNGKVGGYNKGKRNKIALLKKEGIRILKGKIA